jgi:hypothetical protein
MGKNTHIHTQQQHPTHLFPHNIIKGGKDLIGATVKKSPELAVFGSARGQIDDETNGHAGDQQQTAHEQSLLAIMSSSY